MIGITSPGGDPIERVLLWATGKAVGVLRRFKLQRSAGPLLGKAFVRETASEE
jgi:hypothetical protein